MVALPSTFAVTPRVRVLNMTVGHNLWMTTCGAGARIESAFTMLVEVRAP